VIRNPVTLLTVLRRRARPDMCRLLRCDAVALSRYDAADPTDPTAHCAGIARRLEAQTGAGEAAVAPATPGQ
jgi:hypothetical protein